MTSVSTLLFKIFKTTLNILLIMTILSSCKKKEGTGASSNQNQNTQETSNPDNPEWNEQPNPENGTQTSPPNNDEVAITEPITDNPSDPPVNPPVNPPTDPDPCAEFSTQSISPKNYYDEITFQPQKKWQVKIANTEFKKFLNFNPTTTHGPLSLTFLINNQCSGVDNFLRDIHAHEALDQLHPGPLGSEIQSVQVLMNAENIERHKADIISNSCVLGVQNEIVFKPRAVDPQAKDQGHLVAVKANEAQTKFFNSKNGIKKDVVVAIIDTGVDVDHQDLKNRIWTNPGETGTDASGRNKATNRIDDDKDGFVDDVNGWNFAGRNNNPKPGVFNGSYHGTHVAGLAAAESNNGLGVQGIMGANVKIMALNVFGNSSGANTADIDNAIRFAADHGADVINMSLGGPGYSQTTEAALKYALNKDVFVVVAAGNDSFLISTEKDSWNFDTPASFGGLLKGMLSVLSLDSSTGNLSDFTNFSNTAVEMGAPGSENSKSRRGLLSTMPGDKYGRLEGTSMASPVTAGAVALVKGLFKSRNKKVSVSTIEDTFLKGSPSKTNFTSKIKNGKVLELLSLYNETDKISKPRDGCEL